MKTLERQDLMKNLSKTLLRFKLYWDYKSTNAIHADSPGFFNSDKFLYLSTIDKINLKCDAFDGSVVNGIGIRQTIHSTFSPDKPAGYMVVCQPETIHYKTPKKSI